MDRLLIESKEQINMTSADHVCLICMKEKAEAHQYPCPHCGGDDRSLPLQSPALPPRTVLDNRYVLGRTLGQGGFGITYQAYDLRMGNTVAVKEYFPSTLVGRDSSVSSAVAVNAIKGTRAKEEYASGLRHFVFEARRQARLASSPGVVSVTDFFEANNTAYYTMEYVDGATLVRYLKTTISIAEVISLLEPIADSLISIHEGGLIHRDISPDNIMCSRNGTRKLLDFGASHSFTEEESTSGNATLKHGFAPPEQYGTSSMQGPWTDVYAFAATVYWCLTGKIPQDSMDRSIGGDRLQPPSELGAVISPDAEAVLMRGMALPITARYQSMQSFWGKLKRAVNNAQSKNSPNGREYDDSNGKTTVVPSISDDVPSTMDDPEITKVPKKPMDRMRSSRRRSTFPISAQNLSFSSTAGKAVHTDSSKGSGVLPQLEVPVRTKEPPEVAEIVRPYPVPSSSSQSKEMPKTKPAPTSSPLEKKRQPAIDAVLDPPAEKPAPVTEKPAPAGNAPAVPAKKSVTSTLNDKRLLSILALLLLILALLVTAFFWALTHPNTPALPDGSASMSGSSSEATMVSIGGAEYPSDTTELHFIGSDSYSPLNPKGVEYVTLDYLSGSDWRTICSMPSLHRLSLVGLSLTELDGIQNLSELEVLDISGNGLTSLEYLTACKELNELYAADNRLDDCPTLPNLVHLDLAGNQLTDAEFVSSLPRLKTLYLDRNQLTDITPMCSLSSLSTLDLTNNAIKTLKGLEVLPNLKLLYVEGNQLDNQALNDFHDGLPDCALDVEIKPVIPPTIKIGKKTYATNLTKLSLPSSQLSDEDIKELYYMQDLKELELSGNNISDLTPISQITGLTKLIISHNKIEDISSLTALTQLTELYLSSNLISDLTPLASLPQLETLAIGNNPFKDLSPISGLTNMRTLVMCDCGWQDLTHLYNMQKLFEIRISKKIYTKKELEAFQKAVPSVHINQYS